MPAILVSRVSNQQGVFMLRVEPVQTRRGLREFILFPFEHYRNDPNWVPPFIEERFNFFNKHRNPFWQHAIAQLFLARRGSRVVGTIAACIDTNHNQFHHDQQGAWGFFECEHDAEVAYALFRAAEAWIRGQGMRVARGPLSFSINHEYALLVDGFGEPPMMLTPYNPPFYATLIEQCGYTPVMNLFAYVGDLHERLGNAPSRVFRVAEKAARDAGVRVRTIDVRNFEQEVRRVRAVYDGAWQQLWDFVPLTEAEVQQTARSLRPIIDPDLVFLAETLEGQPVGVSVALPDLNQALLRAGGGTMFSFGLARFLWHRRHINQLRLYAMGVVDAYRSRGIDAVFYVRTAQAALAKGYHRIEGSLVLENNGMMNRIIQHLGGTPYKRYRMYEKHL